MCGGQTLDIYSASGSAEPDFAYRVAEKKTAALIRAAVVTGAIIGGADEPLTNRCSDYGTHLGIAFQIVDDILDVTSTPERLGKTPGKDKAQNKLTFVAAYGLDGARRRAEEESLAAAATLSPLGEKYGLLAELARQLTHRNS
jgi:geranylgeranyl diphosphate synthase type II